MSSPSVNQNTYPWQNEPTWSKSEKAIARTAFDAALKRELHEVMQETKRCCHSSRGLHSLTATASPMGKKSRGGRGLLAPWHGRKVEFSSLTLGSGLPCPSTLYTPP